MRVLIHLYTVLDISTTSSGGRVNLGIAVQFNAFDTRASIKAAAQVTSTGMHQVAVGD
jgi:hypothetical protein